MKVVVTGATGFIGQNLIPVLLGKGYEVTAVSRNHEKAETFSWFKDVNYYSFDIHDKNKSLLEIAGLPDKLIHLAWPGLPNYQELFHIENNLVNDYFFLKDFIENGLKHLIVTGTCFEYGMVNGPLSEEMPSNPANPYAIAKDSLRKFLQELQKKMVFHFQWVRLFYLYGPGQNPKSLIAQLDSAIEKGDEYFNMSGGEQLRDYLPVTEAVNILYKIIENKNVDGIINCCSGIPVSVLNLVKKHIEEKKSGIKLNTGYYSYPDYEPMAFWGNNQKISKLEM